MLSFKIKKIGDSYYVYRKEYYPGQLEKRKPQIVPRIGETRPFSIKSRTILAKGKAS
jgi:hypothetical protein